MQVGRQGPKTFREDFSAGFWTVCETVTFLFTYTKALFEQVRGILILYEISEPNQWFSLVICTWCVYVWSLFPGFKDPNHRCSPKHPQLKWGDGRVPRIKQLSTWGKSWYMIAQIRCDGIYQFSYKNECDSYLPENRAASVCKMSHRAR